MVELVVLGIETDTGVSFLVDDLEAPVILRAYDPPGALFAMRMSPVSSADGFTSWLSLPTSV